MHNDDLLVDAKVFIGSKRQASHSPGLGLGVVELCERVERLGSLNKAAADMGMAYSKAWRIVKQAEASLDVVLFVRQGSRGSCLTEEAKALIQVFRKVEREANEYANKVLRESLDDLAHKGILPATPSVSLEKKASPELIARVRALEL